MLGALRRTYVQRRGCPQFCCVVACLTIHAANAEAITRAAEVPVAVARKAAVSPDLDVQALAAVVQGPGRAVGVRRQRGAWGARLCLRQAGILHDTEVKVVRWGDLGQLRHDVGEVGDAGGGGTGRGGSGRRGDAGGGHGGSGGGSGRRGGSSGERVFFGSRHVFGPTFVYVEGRGRRSTLTYETGKRSQILTTAFVLRIKKAWAWERTWAVSSGRKVMTSNNGIVELGGAERGKK